MAEPADMLLTPHDQVWLVIALGGMLIGGMVIGHVTVRLVLWWTERDDRRARGRAGR